MSWYRLTLNREQVEAGEEGRRKGIFFDAFTTAGAPRTMALFRQERADGGVDLLFTPACGEHAAQLLQEWGGTPCERPSMAGLHLLAGHSEMTYYLP